MTAARRDSDAAIANLLYVIISRTGYNSLVFRNREALCSMIRKRTRKTANSAAKTGAIYKPYCRRCFMILPGCFNGHSVRTSPAMVRHRSKPKSTDICISQWRGCRNNIPMILVPAVPGKNIRNAVREKLED